ncbi:MAG: hypothetical protein RL260_4042, partial [Pseudomonadota bacterium]
MTRRLTPDEAEALLIPDPVLETPAAAARERLLAEVAALPALPGVYRY